VIGVATVAGRPRRVPVRVSRLLIPIVLAVAVPASGGAQSVLIQPFVGISFAGDTNIVDLDAATKLRKMTYGGTVTVIGRGILGVEGDFSYVPSFFQRERGTSNVTGSRVVTLMGNVVVAAPLRITGDSLRPYISGGAGMMRSRTGDFFDIFSANRRVTLVGIDVGGGLIGFLTERAGVRWDLRYFRSVTELDAEREPVAVGPNARLSFWRANMAVVVRY
jgi:hypothetical protein